MKTTVKRKLKVWEIALLVGLAIFLISGALALQTQEQLSDKVVRLHVLANSDSEEDQALKLLVRDAILERAEAVSYTHLQARESGNVPVDYTQVRYVKKPAGARPGMVTYQAYQTVYVTPEEALIQRLKES